MVDSPAGPAPSAGAGPAGHGPGAAVRAVVLTYRRPHLAGNVVRSLVDTEGFDPSAVTVVVNGAGGLDDQALEAKVDLLVLPTNTGPAGGFRAGLERAFADPEVRWAYLCEDDVGLFDLPAPRVADVLARVEAVRARPGPAVGAVVAYGLRFVGRGAHAENVVPEPDGSADLVPVDVAAWGATLVARDVVEAGVLPDPSWFFGLEDFDFYCSVRRAGFAVLLDGRSSRAVAHQQTMAGRDEALRQHRPIDAAEPWRSYYHARNSCELIRRHGRPTWFVWHALFSARQFQLARSRAQRLAIVHGLLDGARGRLGEHPRYGRSVGELVAPDETGFTRPEAPGS